MTHLDQEPGAKEMGRDYRLIRHWLMREVRRELQRELERGLLRLQRQAMVNAGDVRGSMELLWSMFIAPLWDRVSNLERNLLDVARETEGSTAALPRTMRDAQFAALEAALEETHGNKTAAAQVLQINLKTLYNMLRRKAGS